MIWFEIAVLILAVIAIWLSRFTYGVPTPRLISDDDLVPVLKTAFPSMDEELQHLGFTPVGNYDCSSEKKMISHLRVYLNKECTTECALIGIHHEELEGKLTREFSSTLSPHGELCTNTNEYFDSTYHPPDHFVVKTPWAASLAELHYNHVEHLDILAKNGFTTCKLTAAGAPDRIVYQCIHAMELQRQKGRMKKLADGSYQLTLWGSIRSAPQVVIMMAYPAVKLLVGQRLWWSRRRYLERAARRARALPAHLRMKSVL